MNMRVVHPLLSLRNVI